MNTTALFIAKISDIAAALNISRMAANNRKLKHNWQPVNESGVDTFDVNTVPGLKVYERSEIRGYLLRKATAQSACQAKIDEIAEQLLEHEKAIRKLGEQIRHLKAKARWGK